MIMNNQQDLNSTDNLQMVEFVRLKKTAQTQSKDRTIPEPPPPPEKRPPPPKMQLPKTQIAVHNIPNMDMPNLDIPVQSERFRGPILNGVEMGSGSIETNITPLFQPKIPLPDRDMRRLIRKYKKHANKQIIVTFVFTVTDTGTVINPQIVKTQPAGMSDQRLIKHLFKIISQSRFKPKTIDGIPFEFQAMQSMKITLKR